MAGTQRDFKDKLLFFFFPLSYTRTYAQSALALLLIIGLFIWSDLQLHSHLSDKSVNGKITDIKIGSKGGNAGGKYSGRSTYYHIQLEGYQRNFLLADASVFENWQFSANDLKKGDLASFKIRSVDEKDLQMPTEYRSQMNIPWPQESSSIKIYGLMINGQIVLSPNSTIRGQTYNRWFWVMVPLFMYALFNILIRTRFRNWTQAAEDKELSERMMAGNKSHQQLN